MSIGTHGAGASPRRGSPGVDARPSEKRHEAPAQDPTALNRTVVAVVDALDEVKALHDPTGATARGNFTHNASIADFSEQGRRAKVNDLLAAVRPLQNLPRKALGWETEAIADVATAIVTGEKRAFEAGTHRANLSHMGEDVHALFLDLGKSVHQIRSLGDVEDLKSRFRQAPEAFRQRQQNLREGLADGDVASVNQVRLVLEQLEEQLSWVNDEALGWDNPYLTTLRNSPLPQAQKEQARAELTAVLRTELASALKGFASFLSQDYVGRASGPPGRAGMAHGPSLYAEDIRRNTDLDWSPEKFHEIGRAEVKALRKELEDSAARFLGIENGPMPELSVLLEAIQDHPANSFPSPEAATWAMKKIVELGIEECERAWGIKLPRKFRTIDLNESEDYAGAAHSRGTETRNGAINWNSAKANKPAELPSLGVHEDLHQVQWVATLMRKDWPALLRATIWNALIEGQGLLSESIAFSSDYYQKCVDVCREAGATGVNLDLVHFGTYSTQMMRSARLVVDTGLHHYGWSREQAIAFMLDNCAMSPERAAKEVDRYIAMPGQALSYRAGAIKQSELIDWAREKMGDRFDAPWVRSLLVSYSGPLPLLEKCFKQQVEESLGGARLP